MVIDPTQSSHTLKVIPRFYPCNDLVVSLYNEATQLSEDVGNTYKIHNGKLEVTFDYTFKENDRFQVKFDEGGSIVYRGKRFATTQEPQEYRLTNKVYTN